MSPRGPLPKRALRWHSKHPADPFSDHHLAPLARRRSGHKFGPVVDHTALSDAVMQWLEEHEGLDLPPYITQAVMRYTFAGIRYFLVRGHQVRIYRWGAFITREHKRRAMLNQRIGVRQWRPARVQPTFMPFKQWIEQLTYQRFQRSAFPKTEERKRAEWFLREVYPPGSTHTLTYTLLESFGLTYQTLLAAARRLQHTLTEDQLIDDLSRYAVQPPPPTWRSCIEREVEAELPQLERAVQEARRVLEQIVLDPEQTSNARQAARREYRRVHTHFSARKRLLASEQRDRQERQTRDYSCPPHLRVRARLEAARTQFPTSPDFEPGTSSLSEEDLTLPGSLDPSLGIPGRPGAMRFSRRPKKWGSKPGSPTPEPSQTSAPDSPAVLPPDVPSA